MTLTKFGMASEAGNKTDIYQGISGLL